METHEKVALVSHLMNGLRIEGCSLNRRVALGVKNGGVDQTDAWVILDFADGSAKLSELRQLGPMRDADAEMDAAIVVCATEAVWRAIGHGGKTAAITAADEHQIAISGKLPFFIRHVRSVVELMVIFGVKLDGFSGEAI